MTAPERIWMTSLDSEGEVEVWLDPDDGGIEYILHTPAALAASPLVQEIVAEAFRAGFNDSAEGWNGEYCRPDEDFDSWIDKRSTEYAAAIRARCEGQPQEKGE